MEIWKWEGWLQLWGRRVWWAGAPRGSSGGWRWRPGKAGGRPWRLKIEFGICLLIFFMLNSNSPPLLPSLGWVILLAFGEKSHSPWGGQFAHFINLILAPEPPPWLTSHPDSCTGCQAEGLQWPGLLHLVSSAWSPSCIVTEKDCL